MARGGQSALQKGRSISCDRSTSRSLSPTSQLEGWLDRPLIVIVEKDEETPSGVKVLVPFKTVLYMRRCTARKKADPVRPNLHYLPQEARVKLGKERIHRIAYLRNISDRVWAEILPFCGRTVILKRDLKSRTKTIRQLRKDGAKNLKEWEDEYGRQKHQEEDACAQREYMAANVQTLVPITVIEPNQSAAQPIPSGGYIVQIDPEQRPSLEGTDSTSSASPVGSLPAASTQRLEDGNLPYENDTSLDKGHSAGEAMDVDPSSYEPDALCNSPEPVSGDSPLGNSHLSGSSATVLVNTDSAHDDDTMEVCNSAQSFESTSDNPAAPVGSTCAIVSPAPAALTEPTPISSQSHTSSTPPTTQTTHLDSRPFPRSLQPFPPCPCLAAGVPLVIPSFKLHHAIGVLKKEKSDVQSRLDEQTAAVQRLKQELAASLAAQRDMAERHHQMEESLHEKHRQTEEGLRAELELQRSERLGVERRLEAAARVLTAAHH